MDKITVTRKSLRAFGCGLFGFIPVIGLLPSLEALSLWFRIRKNYQGWNPAAKYLRYAAVLGLFGLLYSLLAVLVIIIAVTDKLLP